MKEQSRVSPQSTNQAAELFVASQLSRLGYAVTITFGNTKVIDLLVAHPDGRTVSIDVKGLKNRTNWPLKLKVRRATHFFVLVSYLDRLFDLRVTPEVYVIPSMHVNKLLSSWTGMPHVTAIAYSKVKNSMYKGAWHLLFGDKVVN